MFDVEECSLGGGGRMLHEGVDSIDVWLPVSSLCPLGLSMESSLMSTSPSLLTSLIVSRVFAAHASSRWEMPLSIDSIWP